MRVAVTGVSGFIGSAIARRLAGAGHRVTGLVRATSRRDHVEAFVDRFVVGTHDDDSCWPALLDGAECVIHNSIDWAPLRASPMDLTWHLRTNLDASIRLLHTSSPRQFVFISTIAVHHDMLPRPKDGSGRCVITEDHPLRPNSVYGAHKAAIEAFLWAEHFGSGRNTCALRPCGVYGVEPNPSDSHGADIIAELRRTGRYANPGGGKWVHVEDVAAAAAEAVGNERVAGRPFNLVDCYARYADWARLAAEELGLQAEIDTSTPEQPNNTFDVSAARDLLGVALDRGHEGIRRHLRELIGAIGS
ncbi:MAG: NAD(P)-dependent oxidoreductase [Phycisphaeraceae bacterium]|nr:NAD(P)-dependent oxidoreductase [Phycisphaeraceae bacterium]